MIGLNLPCTTANTYIGSISRFPFSLFYLLFPCSYLPWWSAAQLTAAIVILFSISKLSGVNKPFGCDYRFYCGYIMGKSQASLKLTANNKITFKCCDLIQRRLVLIFSRHQEIEALFYNQAL